MSRAQRVVMVTGASGNLGRAVAQRFTARGDFLVLLDRHPVRDAGHDGELHVRADLLAQTEVDAAVRAAIERFGHIDVLCNLAGAFRMGEPVHRTDDDTWDFMFDVNARTVLHAVRAVAPHMVSRGLGHIVNVASQNALRGAPLMAAYSASKSAVVRMTESMATELGPHGINVNCVSPSTMDTPENRAAMPLADPTSWVSLGDVASVVELLCSPQARAIHGASIPLGRAT